MNKSVYEKHILSKFLIFMGITIAMVVFFTNSIAKKQEERNFMAQKKQTLEKEVQNLEKKNSKLYRQHNALLTDPLQIERYARENLNFVAPGEESFETKNFKVLPNDNSNKNVTVPEKHPWSNGFPWQVPAIIILVSTIAFYISYCFENYKSKKSL